MEFYTVKELAQILKISTRTVIKLIEEKKIRASKVGREWRVQREYLDEYLKKNENQI
jgi:excisionase family DNA binding protein